MMTKTPSAKSLFEGEKMLPLLALYAALAVELADAEECKVECALVAEGDEAGEEVSEDGPAEEVLGSPTVLDSLETLGTRDDGTSPVELSAAVLGSGVVALPRAELTGSSVVALVAAKATVALALTCATVVVVGTARAAARDSAAASAAAAARAEA